MNLVHYLDNSTLATTHLGIPGDISPTLPFPHLQYLVSLSAMKECQVSLPGLGEGRGTPPGQPSCSPHSSFQGRGGPVKT